MTTERPDDSYRTDQYIPFDDVDYYLEIGRNVAYYRNKAGLSQQELAKRAGLSRSYISHLESKNVPHKCSLDSLFKICRALKIEPVKLFLPLP